MKKSFALIIFAALTVISCQKKEQIENRQNAENTSGELIQKEQILKNNEGETVSVVYFADGKEIAVKLKKAGKEHHLIARGSSEQGEPQFSDGEMVWELMEDGQSGRMTEKGGKVSVYRVQDEVPVSE